MVEHQLPKLRVAGSIPVVRLEESPGELVNGAARAWADGSRLTDILCIARMHPFRGGVEARRR